MCVVTLYPILPGINHMDHQPNQPFAMKSAGPIVTIGCPPWAARCPRPGLDRCGGSIERPGTGVPFLGESADPPWLLTMMVDRNDGWQLEGCCFPALILTKCQGQCCSLSFRSYANWYFPNTEQRRRRLASSPWTEWCAGRVWGAGADQSKILGPAAQSQLKVSACAAKERGRVTKFGEHSQGCILIIFLDVTRRSTVPDFDSQINDYI